MTNVSAHDADATSPNNMISYFINAGARDNFAIDRHSGEITVSNTALLDPSLYGVVYHIGVMAIDGGSPPLIGSCQIDVTVVDVGDKPPTMTSISDVMVASVVESATVNSVFYKVNAVNPAGKDRLLYNFAIGSAVGYDVRGQLMTDQSYLMVCHLLIIIALLLHNTIAYLGGSVKV